MTDQRSRPLFRQAALQWRQESWMGATQNLEPVPNKWVAVAVAAALFFSMICLYAAFGSYTRRVHAAGAMVPKQGLVTAKADQDGVVAQINVQEGQHVHLGDHLFSIDVAHHSYMDATGRNSLDSLKTQYRLLKEKRLLAEKDAPITLYVLKAHLETLKKQRAMLKAQIARDEKILPMVDRATKQMQDAIGTRLVTQTQFQSQLNVYFQSFNVHAQMVRALNDVEGQESAERLKILQHPIETARQYNEIDAQLAECGRQMVLAGRDMNSTSEARIAGTVDGIAVTVGQRVRNNQALLTILPDQAELIAELFVSSQAAGFIHVGQTVLLKYASYPYQRFGLYQGRVVEVTQSPLDAQPMTGLAGAVATSTARDPYQYRIRVKPADDDVVMFGRHEKLRPGMRVEAEIAVDHRRLYQWLLDPIISTTEKLRQISRSDGEKTTS